MTTNLYSAEVKERVELYLYSPLGLRDLFWGEIYLYIYADDVNILGGNVQYRLLRETQKIF